MPDNFAIAVLFLFISICIIHYHKGIAKWGVEIDRKYFNRKPSKLKIKIGSIGWLIAGIILALFSIYWMFASTFNDLINKLKGFIT
jgi:hypothetical protein